jgi:RNA polymerase sigma-70 factor, ECF subfamily
VSSDCHCADGYRLEQFRVYLRLLADHQLGHHFRGKVDPSGIAQETLWEAHQQLAGGASVPSHQRLPWLRRILANNLADEVRRMTADKRDVGREVSIEKAVEQSSVRLEQWLAVESPVDDRLDREERLLALADALARLPDAQRDAVTLHYWSGWTLAQISERLNRSRDAVAGLLKRGLRQLREDMASKQMRNAPVKNRS